MRGQTNGETEDDEGSVFIVVEDGTNVAIEISEENYQPDLAAGIDEEDTLKPDRYKMKRGGFFARHPEMKIKE
jgi:hypothetical protein